MRYEEDYVEQEGRNLPKYLPVAVLSVAVLGFALLANYAYHNGGKKVKDDDLLVIEADKTPIKEKPADAGGMKFPNQDKTVFETFSNSSPQLAKVERVLPAPEEPMKREDILPETGAEAEKSAAAPAPEAKQESKPESVLEKTGTVKEQKQSEKLEKTSEEPAPPAEKPSAASKKEETAKPQKTAEESKPAKQEVASKGAVKIQLGAYKSEAEAKQEWARIKGKFPALASRSPQIVKASVGGKDFFRLRVGGFASEKDAKALCATISAKGQGCIVPKG